MQPRMKRALRIAAITVAALIVIGLAGIAVAVNFVFTPEKLTPVVVDVANRHMDAKLDMGSVELTFFSTFPRFGLKLTDGTLVSKSLRDTLWQRPDTLLAFKKVVLVVNPVDYLRQQKISIYRLVLDSPRIYAHKSKDGRANWDILKASADTAVADTTAADTTRVASEIDIRRVTLRKAVLTYDDRETRVFANLWDVNLNLTANLRRGHSTLALDWSNKNILFQGNRIKIPIVFSDT